MFFIKRILISKVFFFFLIKGYAKGKGELDENRTKDLYPGKVILASTESGSDSQQVIN
jgi:hypothetical protein